VKHFEFVRPRDLAELLRIKAELREKALILDGGTNLLIYIKDGIIREGTIVDVTRLPELRGVHRENGTVEIGAAETMTDLLNSGVLRESIPFIPECLRDFGNLLVRNTSTIGGNIADASPIADSAPPLMVLDAEIIAASSAGTRAIPIDEFFVKPQKTMLKPDEVLVKFRIPVPGAGRGKFIKLGLRRGTSCSVTSVAVWLVKDKKTIQDVRIALEEGNVELDMEKLSSGGVGLVNVDSGDITVKVLPSFRCEVIAHAPRKKIHMELPIEVLEKDKDRLRGTLNGGGTKIELIAPDGEIRFQALTP